MFSGRQEIVCPLWSGLAVRKQVSQLIYDQQPVMAEMLERTFMGTRLNFQKHKLVCDVIHFLFGGNGVEHVEIRIKYI